MKSMNITKHIPRAAISTALFLALALVSNGFLPGDGVHASPESHETSEETSRAPKAEKEPAKEAIPEEATRPETDAISKTNGEADSKPSQNVEADETIPKAESANEQLDREWILKKPGPPDTPEATGEGIDWRDEARKKECVKLLERLREQYLQARYYSIKGDSCATAAHSEMCLELVRQCREKCPDNYLEASGYKHRIIRNWKRLYELGTEKCLK